MEDALDDANDALFGKIDLADVVDEDVLICTRGISPEFTKMLDSLKDGDIFKGPIAFLGDSLYATVLLGLTALLEPNKCKLCYKYLDDSARLACNCEDDFTGSNRRLSAELWRALDKIYDRGEGRRTRGCGRRPSSSSP